MKLLRSVNEFTAFTNLKLPPWLNLTYIHMHPLTRRPSEQSDPWYEVPCASQPCTHWVNINNFNPPTSSLWYIQIKCTWTSQIQLASISCSMQKWTHGPCKWYTALNINSPASDQPAMAGVACNPCRWPSRTDSRPWHAINSTGRYQLQPCSE